MYCVIGSGPASISAAMALVKRGLRVTILDGGRRLEPERQAVLDRLGGQKPEEWSAPDLDRLRGDDQSSRHGVDPLEADVRIGISVRRRGRAAGRGPEHSPFHYSMARGGLSNVWGASILPARQRDMEGWPIMRRGPRGALPRGAGVHAIDRRPRRARGTAPGLCGDGAAADAIAPDRGPAGRFAQAPRRRCGRPASTLAGRAWQSRRRDA